MHDCETTAWKFAISGDNKMAVERLYQTIIKSRKFSNIYIHQQSIVKINRIENVVITTGYNGSSAGPLTIANGVTVTVSNNSTWTIF